MNNPFFTDYNQPYDAVPFSKFKADHFMLLILSMSNSCILTLTI